MPRYKTRKLVEFDTDDLDWFESTHPGSSLWWLMNSLLKSYRIYCDENLTPIEIVKKGVERFRAEQDAGFHEELEDVD